MPAAARIFTRKQKILSWASLLVFSFALRIGLAVASPNIFFPDEIFQTLEPAHRLMYGYGVITWEWRMGIRSWVFPTSLAGVMRASAPLGGSSPGQSAAAYLLGVQIVLSLLSLVAVWFAFAWARRASGRPAAVIAAVACSFYFGLVYFAPKALNEVVAAHVMLPGLYLGVYGESLSERKRLFLAGLLCGLAACLRIQLLPAILFALIWFCYPRWRQRVPAVAAGVAVPVLLFGAVDWITWSYPWQSFIRYFQANAISGPGTTLMLRQPWYWYVLVLVVLIGPAILLLFHGARRSPFLAIFCAIVIVSHSFIPHKEIRFIYPILTPALTLAAMGIVDLFHELAPGMKFLANPKWVLSIGIGFFLVSSGLLTAQCRDWCKTGWGLGAFDRLRNESSLCGVGMYKAIWWESGGYTHLHRDVPIIQVNSVAQLAQDVPVFNALIAPHGTAGIPSGFNERQCWKGVCLFERPGVCTPPKPGEEINAYLKGMGQ